MLFRIIIIACMLISHTLSFSDFGKWDLSLCGENCEFTIAKSLFEKSQVIVMLHCDVSEPTNVTVIYRWTPTPCSPDYFHYFEKNIVECSNRMQRSIENANSSVQTLKVQQTYLCHNRNTIIFSDESNGKSLDDAKAQTVQSQTKIPPLLTVEKTGIYVLRMAVLSDKMYNVSFHIEMKSPYGYLSAAIWPLLVFYGVMSAIYTILCTGWLVVCGLQWRDLLRIQYWIGAVALLGMIESATFYAIYSSVNETGYFSSSAYMLAEWISVAKRALARMLVIIVSLGFGIVKPRLGPALQRVVGTGVLWGALATIEAWLRLHHKASDSNKDLLLSEAPLSLLDSAITWWLFASLHHTMRTLQLRRNMIKLTLYRHFMNTLIFAVVSSVIFMLYSIKSYRFLPCITDWKEVWLDEGYWHMQFAGVLTVIMILWRPTNNNQRYAFTPLLDNAEDDDDEEEEQFVNDAYGVKMRTTSINVSGDAAEKIRDSLQPEQNANSLEADLRWVEENIPASTLPILDSDDELINTKFEVSKMQ